MVARAESVIRDKSRKTVTDARYVAALGGQEEFRAALKAALDAELADDVMKIVWLGDGARENWTMAPTPRRGPAGCCRCPALRTRRG